MTIVNVAPEWRNTPLRTTELDGRVKVSNLKLNFTVLTYSLQCVWLFHRRMMLVKYVKLIVFIWIWSLNLRLSSTSCKTPRECCKVNLRCVKLCDDSKAEHRIWENNTNKELRLA